MLANFALALFVCLFVCVLTCLLLMHMVFMQVLCVRREFARAMIECMLEFVIQKLYLNRWIVLVNDCLLKAFSISQTSFR